MTISGAELQTITAGDLKIGYSGLLAGAQRTTGNIFIDNVRVANTQNVSGTVTLTSSSDISFQRKKSTFRTLTLTADRDISLERNVETTVGDFDASAGIFAFDTGTTLTSAGDVTINAFIIERFGTINAAGTETLIGRVVNRDLRNEIQDRIDESIEQANNSNFLPDLFEIASGGC